MRNSPCRLADQPSRLRQVILLHHAQLSDVLRRAHAWACVSRGAPLVSFASCVFVGIVEGHGIAPDAIKQYPWGCSQGGVTP